VISPWQRERMVAPDHGDEREFRREVLGEFLPAREALVVGSVSTRDYQRAAERLVASDASSGSAALGRVDLRQLRDEQVDALAYGLAFDRGRGK
jgi:hypothetical protein